MEWHGTARSSASISTAKGRSFEYRSIHQFCGKRAALLSPTTCLFPSFPPDREWPSFLLLMALPSMSLPTPGRDLSPVRSPQFNLSLKTYKKDIKTFSTRLMHRAQQRGIPSCGRMKFTGRIACSASLNMPQLKCVWIYTRNARKRQQTCLHAIGDDDML